MERQAVAKVQKMPTGNDHPHRQSTRATSAGHTLLELQRTVGNQAIRRLTSSPFIQAKLQVSAPEDESELEADRVADSVMRMPEPVVSRQIVAPKSNSRIPVAVREDDEEEKPLVQRACTECEEEKLQDQGEPGGMIHRKSAPEQPDDDDVEEQHVQPKGVQTATPKVTSSVAANIQAMNGGGSSLPATTRAFFEPRFGADLSQVRVHTDSRAVSTASSIQARAFTVGPNIAFGAGQFAPESREGRQLLAHELTHVLQQNSNKVQRDSKLKITKKLTDMSRAEVRQALQDYFEKTMKAQGGKGVRMTKDLKNTLSRILLNDMEGVVKLDSYLGRSNLPTSPAELAAGVAEYLPDPLEASRLAHLGASSGPGPTTMERVGDLVKKTEPFESPDTLEQKWKFDREATNLRKGEGAIGPFGVDLNRIFNIGKGLPGAVKSPPSPTKAVEARSYPQVDAVIAKISKTMLVPAEAKGTANADNFADAQLVARDLARQLDIAYQQKNDSVTLQLGPNYNGVKDREDMIREAIKLVQIIRDALPHQALGVRFVDLYFGARLVQRIPLESKAE